MTLVRGLIVAHGAAIATSIKAGLFVFLFVAEAAVHASPSLPPPASQRSAALQSALRRLLPLPRRGSRFRLPVLASTVRGVAASQHHGHWSVLGCPAQPQRVRTPVMSHLVCRAFLMYIPTLQAQAAKHMHTRPSKIAGRGRRYGRWLAGMVCDKRSPSLQLKSENT